MGEEGKSWAGDRGINSKTVVKEEEVGRIVKGSLFSKEYRNSRYGKKVLINQGSLEGMAAHNVICLRLSVVTLCTCMFWGIDKKTSFVVSGTVTYCVVGRNGISHGMVC